MSYKDYYEAIEEGNLEEDAEFSQDSISSNAWRIRTQRTVSMMAKLLAVLKRDALIVDVGCAGGWLNTGLIEKGCNHRYVGCDISLSYLSLWKDNRNSTRVLCDASSLPFRNGATDIVVSLETIEHLPNPEPASDELLRVCKYFAMVSVPLEGISLFGLDSKRYDHNAIKKERLMREFIDRVGWANGLKQITKKTGSAHINFFTRNKLLKLFEKEEFSPLLVIGALFMIPFIKPILNVMPLRSFYNFLERILLCRIPIFTSFIRFLPFGRIGNLYGILQLKRIKRKNAKVT
ncbi:MAG: class I SAM-dependent methyltransferase [Candidatus Thorarchaeota archaeon]|nr:class I SAM-dependent methyltransferase [Candidatus Thorarchaeota archaeon]